MGLKRVVLAIDDEMMLLDLFQKMLIPDYDVKTANSAADALQYLNSEKADVILLDIEMPNITGFEFLNEIRKIPHYYNIPVIIVSGYSGDVFIKKAVESGAANVLQKPVKKEILIETIEKAIASKNG
jgi:CheY-like chemotaxis protein